MSDIPLPSPKIASLQVDELETPPLTLWQMARRRFRRHKMAMLGLVFLAFIFAFSTVGALVYKEADANFTDTSKRLEAPSREHIFGTDTVGRDILARMIYGAQISILIGITAVVVELTIGILFGSLSGYYGGSVDSVLMRFTEAVLVIPQIFLLLVMAKFFAGLVPNINILGREFSGSVVIIILIIGLTSWPYTARIVRAQFLSLKENEYILAARSIGTPRSQIILQHILPNSVAPIVVAATLGVAGAITLEAYISFLGLGVRPPTATWGNMLEGSYNYIEEAWWLWFFPGMFIAITVLSINFIGDGLRDALDPRSRAI